MAKHVLFTGAAGHLGRQLVPHLARRGYRLKLTDVQEFTDPLPAEASFVQADLAHFSSVRDLVNGVDAILHFGGISNDKHPWERIVDANVLGTTHLFEAARSTGARVVSASSHHVVGYHARGDKLSAQSEFRCDGYYSLTKAWSELLGRMMHDKFGVESLHLRIGSALDEPVEARHLATWISMNDLLRLVVASLEAPKPGFAVVWGVSGNSGRWWFEDDSHRIGYFPKENAADFFPLPDKADDVGRRFQGGSFAADGYVSRDEDAHS